MSQDREYLCEGIEIEQVNDTHCILWVDNKKYDEFFSEYAYSDALRAAEPLVYERTWWY